MLACLILWEWAFRMLRGLLLWVSLVMGGDVGGCEGYSLWMNHMDGLQNFGQDVTINNIKQLSLGKVVFQKKAESKVVGEMKKLFTNDKFFLAMVLCALIGEGAFALISIFVWNDTNPSRIILLMRLICVAVIYISYIKHSKNVMKGMMGALLMAQLITSILLVSYPKPYMAVILAIVCVVVNAMLFINHFIINSYRKASPAMIKLSQILWTILFVLNAIGDVMWTLADPDIPYIRIAFVLDVIGFAGMSAIVICVESRLDAYRLDREAAGWTEEKGYPEGYVHEYEKKQK